jgi:hypothetical protein
MNKLYIASAKYGLILSLALIILNFVSDSIDPLGRFDNIYIKGFSFMINIALLYSMSVDIRKSTGGYWSYGEAASSLLIIVFFVALITTAYNFILFKFIEPDLPSKLKDAKIAEVISKLNAMGLDQESIDKVVKPLQDGEMEAKLKPTLINELKSFALSFLLLCIESLIIAVFVKKKKGMLLASEPLENALH